MQSPNEDSAAVLQELIRELETALARHNRRDSLNGVSYEIRVPLNAVVGLAELLLETNLDDPQREYASMIRKSGESALDALEVIFSPG